MQFTIQSTVYRVTVLELLNIALYVVVSVGRIFSFYSLMCARDIPSIKHVYQGYSGYQARVSGTL